MVDKSTVLRNLPLFRGVWVKVKGNQDVHDIVNEILESHKTNAGYYDKICYLFDDVSIYEICNKIYDFIKENIPYTEETEDEQTSKTPMAMLSGAKGLKFDCKHYSGFAAGILSGLNRRGRKINWCYRFASYRPFDSDPHHVFVVVKNEDGTEYWVDPVPGSGKKNPVWFIDKKVNDMSVIRNISGVNEDGLLGSESIPYYWKGKWYFPYDFNTIGSFSSVLQSLSDVGSASAGTALSAATGNAGGVAGGIVNLVQGIANLFKSKYRAAQKVYDMFPITNATTPEDLYDVLKAITQEVANSPKADSEWKAAFADILTKYGTLYGQMKGFTIKAVQPFQIVASQAAANQLLNQVTNPVGSVQASSTTAAVPGGSLTQNKLVSFAMANPLLLIGGGVGMFYLIRSMKKSKKLSGVKGGTVLLLGAVILFLFLKNKKQKDQHTTIPASSLTDQEPQPHELSESVLSTQTNPVSNGTLIKQENLPEYDVPLIDYTVPSGDYDISLTDPMINYQGIDRLTYQTL